MPPDAAMSSTPRQPAKIAPKKWLIPVILPASSKITSENMAYSDQIQPKSSFPAE